MLLHTNNNYRSKIFFLGETNRDDKTKTTVTIDIRGLELKSVYKLSKSEQHLEILDHPVIASFLQQKWQAISLFYWTNLIFILSFASAMTSYFCLRYYNGHTKENDNKLLRGLAILFVIVRFLQKFLQVISDWKRYNTNKWSENVHEILVVIFSLQILFQEDERVSSFALIGYKRYKMNFRLNFAQHVTVFYLEFKYKR